MPKYSAIPPRTPATMRLVRERVNGLRKSFIGASSASVGLLARSVGVLLRRAGVRWVVARWVAGREALLGRLVNLLVRALCAFTAHVRTVVMLVTSFVAHLFLLRQERAVAVPAPQGQAWGVGRWALATATANPRGMKAS